MNTFGKVKILDRLENISRNKSTDALIIHGMLSNSGNLRNLKKALDTRRCYRKIHLIEMPLTHKIIPHVMSKADAKLLAEKLMPKIRRGNIEGPIDIIGHSNGGYVAMWLTNLIDCVNYVFTIATPPGLTKEYGLKRSNFRKIIHFKGSKDVFNKTLSWNTPMTESEFVFEFPDDGHCSIHIGASENGLADIISYMNGNNSSHVFLDNRNVLHIWPFCKYEVAKSNRRISGIPSVRVCNGIHESEILELEEQYNCDDYDAISSIRKYYLLRQALKNKIELLNSYKNQLRPQLNMLKVESNSLDKELKYMDKRLKDFERVLIKKTNLLLNEHKSKTRAILEPLELCIRISSSNGLNDKTLQLINELLRLSNKRSASYIKQGNQLLKKI